MEAVAAPELPRQPGWYAQPGNSTMRWWSGTGWVGQPSAINPTIIPGASHRGSNRDRRLAGKRSDQLVGLIAASAIISFAASYFAAAAPGASLVQSIVASNSGPTIIGLLTIVLAFADRRRQLTNGQPTAASGFWILLTPTAYLAARGYHVSRYRKGAWVPFWIYLSSVLATVVYTIVISAPSFAAGFATGFMRYGG
jgi:hypothetical protein